MLDLWHLWSLELVRWVKPNSCVCDVLSTSFLNETRLSSSLASLTPSTPKKAWRCLEFLLLGGAMGALFLGSIVSDGISQGLSCLVCTKRRTLLVSAPATCHGHRGGGRGSRWSAWPVDVSEEILCVAERIGNLTNNHFMGIYWDIYPAIYGIWMCPTMGYSRIPPGYSLTLIGKWWLTRGWNGVP